MFRSYYFTEMPYPTPPALEFTDVVRTVAPTRWLDPEVLHDVYHKYFDLVQAADDLGIDVMFNEHHQTMHHLNAAMPLSMAIAARETKKCRILALGNPIALRTDPLRVATEMAMIDIVSHGRLECGFIKGAPFEISATNGKPLDLSARLFEAADLIVKAWTSHDGPFNWEGEYFHHRQVNVVPRPYQQPHPPVWGAVSGPASVPPLAERGYTVNLIFSGTDICKKAYEKYREIYANKFGCQPHPDKLAYSSWIFVGDTDEEALNEAPKLQDFLVQSSRLPKGQFDVPGFVDLNARAAYLKALWESPEGMTNQRDTAMTDPRLLIDKGTAFYGSPDFVFEQLKAFFYDVGGFGNFIGMFHASSMTYALTTKSMRLFAEHVLPRLRAEVYEPWLKEHGLKQVLLPKHVREAGAAPGATQAA